MPGHAQGAHSRRTHSARVQRSIVGVKHKVPRIFLAIPHHLVDQRSSGRAISRASGGRLLLFECVGDPGGYGVGFGGGAGVVGAVGVVPEGGVSAEFSGA